MDKDFPQDKHKDKVMEQIKHKDVYKEEAPDLQELQDLQEEEDLQGRAIRNGSPKHRRKMPRHLLQRSTH